MNTTANQNDAVVAYCRTCGKPLSDATKREVYGVIYCEDCLASRVHGGQAAQAAMPQQSGQVAYVATAPNPALAFILGFIPGVGAMYNGQVAKGFVHVGIFAGIIAVLNSVGGNADGIQAFFGIGLAGFVFYMAFEAYQTAKALRFGQPAPDYLRILHTLDSMGMKSEAGRAYVAPMQAPPGAQAAGGPQPTQSYAQPGQSYAQPGQSYAQPGPGQTYQAYVAPVQTVQAVEVEPGPERIPVSAIVLIVLGALFLLSTLNVFNFEGRFFFPVLLIALGVWLAVRRMAGGR